MNKRNIISILRKLIQAYKNNQLNKESYEKYILEESKKELNEVFLVLEETELICYLFKEIPYYQIIPFLNKLLSHLKGISDDSSKEFLTILITGYLSDLMTIINYRVETEIKAHILLLLHEFYVNYEYNSSKIKEVLRKNIVLPEINTSADIARDLIFKQQVLLGINIENVSLREQVSLTSAKRKYNIENDIRRIVSKKFNETLLDEFIFTIINALEDLSEIIVADNLLLIYTNHLENLRKYLIRNPLEVEENQMSLF